MGESPQAMWWMPDLRKPYAQATTPSMQGFENRGGSNGPKLAPRSRARYFNPLPVVEILTSHPLKDLAEKLAIKIPQMVKGQN